MWVGATKDHNYAKKKSKYRAKKLATYDLNIFFS